MDRPVQSDQGALDEVTVDRPVQSDQGALDEVTVDRPVQSDQGALDEVTGDRPVQSDQGALDEIHKQHGGSQDDSVKEIGALRDSKTLEKQFGMMQNLQFNVDTML